RRKQRGERRRRRRGERGVYHAQPSQQGDEHQGDFCRQPRVGALVPPVAESGQTGDARDRRRQPDRAGDHDADGAAKRRNGERPDSGRRPRRAVALAALALRADQQSDAQGDREAQNLWTHHRDPCPAGVFNTPLNRLTTSNPARAPAPPAAARATPTAPMVPKWNRSRKLSIPMTADVAPSTATRTVAKAALGRINADRKS